MPNELPDLTRAFLEQIFGETELEMFGKTTEQMQVDGDESEHGAPLYLTARYDVMELIAKRLVEAGYSVQRVEDAFEHWGEDKRPEDEDWRPFWSANDALPFISHTDLEGLYREVEREESFYRVEDVRRDSDRESGVYDESKFFSAHNVVLKKLKEEIVRRGYTPEYAERTVERWRSSHTAEPQLNRADLLSRAREIRAQMRRNGEPVDTSEVIDRLAKQPGRKPNASRAAVVAALRSRPGSVVSAWRSHIEAERISRLYAVFEDLARIRR